MKAMAARFRASVLDCGSPLPLSPQTARSQSGRGLPHSKTLTRYSPRLGDLRVSCNGPRLGSSLKPLAAAGLLLALLVPWRCLAAADLAPALSRLPRTNLLVFHDRAGAVQTAKSKSDWQLT